MLLHTAPKMPIPRYPSSRHRVRHPKKESHRVRHPQKESHRVRHPQKESHCVRRVTGGYEQVHAKKRKQGIPTAPVILHSSFFIYIHPDSIAMFRT